MRQADRNAVARSINELGDALDDDDDDAVVDAAAEVRERLELLLLRDEERPRDEEDPLVRVRAKFKRGSGVRDEDEWTIMASGATVEDAEERFDRLLALHGDRWEDRVRATGED